MADHWPSNASVIVAPNSHICGLMSLTLVLYVIACVAVPIGWGIAVNWVFRRLKRNSGSDNSETTVDEPLIEYYI